MNSSIAAAIRRVTRIKNLEGLDVALEEAANDIVIPDARRYPPERPGQRYVRTFRLRDAWNRTQVTRSGNRLRIVVRNQVSYAPDVVGSNQEHWFKNRWRTVRQIRDENEPAVRAHIRAAVLRLGRRR